MRQLCNVVYALLTANKTGKEIEQLDKELRAVPGRPVSHGTGGLMAAFGMAARGR